MKMTTRDLTISAVMIALAVALSYVPIPSPTGTVSLDATPGYVSAVIINPFIGGIIGLIGHILVSIKNGFPLGIFHIYIAITMFALCYAFGYFFKRNSIIAIIVAYILNVVVGLVPFIFTLGVGFVLSMLLPLSIGALINIIIAVIIPKYFYNNY